MRKLIPAYNKTGRSQTLLTQANVYIKQTCYRLLLLACCLVVFSNQSSAQGTWTKVTSDAPHFNEGVMLLMTDGTVLCKTSSGATYGNTWDKLTPDIHGSYINGTWTTIAAMHDDRLYFSSQVLPDGRVYVAGGEYGPGGVKAEVYDPKTNLWTPCPQLVVGAAISDANSELLLDGKVLQAIVDTGGTNLCAIYDPGTNTYAYTASTIRHDNEAVWVKLPDSTILFNDGFEATTSERFNQKTHTWITDGNLPVTLYDPYGDEAGAGFLLPNGKVYFIGSLPNSAYYTPTGTLSPGTWTAGPALPNGWGAPDAASAMMTNGHVLMNLSPPPTSPDHFPDSSAFFDFDYTTGIYTSVGNRVGSGDTLDGTPAYFSNMLCLPDGTILSSTQYDNSYFEYTPVSGPLAAGQPAISGIIENTCTTFTITGTLFNGITEGAAYGDDWQMSTNYPIVRLTSGSLVYYATTSNWNRIGAVMTGALPDTAQFKLPVGIPNGTYNVQVVVNGNPSANFPLTVGPPAITPLTSTVCAGADAALTASIGGGTWSSANTAIATVGTSGIVTGVAASTTTISYSLGTCAGITTVTIVPSPGAINPVGATSLCEESSAILSDAPGGGVWSSSNSAVATVDFFGNTFAASSGTATITYTEAGCSATKTITVNPLPNSITGSTTICSGFTSALSDAGGGTWSSSNSTVASVVPGTGLVTGMSFGTATIDYVLGTGCSTTVVVNVNTSPGAITGNLGVCIGASSALSDGGGGTWTSSNTTVAPVGLASGNVSGLTTGTATISYSLGAGCSAIAVVTVNPLPNVISGTTTVCQGAATTLSDAGLGTWTSSNTSVATIGLGTGALSGVSGGSAIIIYTLPTGCSRNITATVNSLPAIITGATSVCAGQSTPLSDATGGGVWNSSNTAVSVNSSTGLVTGLFAGPTTISYNNGCVVTYVMTVNPVPAAITGSPNLCVGLTTALTDVTASGVWTSGNTSVATVDGVGTVTGSLAGTATISYTLGTGCAAAANVIVHNTPSAITGAAAFCTGSTIPLSDAVTGGAWSSASTGTATVDSVTGIVTGVSLGTANIVYTLGAGCTAAATVTVSTGPSSITGSTTICTGATSALSDLTPSGTWSSTNTGIATVSVSGSVLGVTAGTSTISYSLGVGCATTSVVNIITSTAAAITGSSSVCVAQATSLSDATPSGVWSSSSTGIATVDIFGNVHGISAGGATISYSVTNTCGTAIATQPVTVSSLPVVAAITGSPNVCIASSVTLADVTPLGVWSSGNTAIATVSAGVVTGVALGTVPVSYTVTNIAGCTTSVATSVTVNLTAPAITGTASVCPGSTTTLSDPATGGVWSSSNTALATVDAVHGIVSGVTSGAPVITYVVAGCTAVTTLVVDPLPTLHSMTGGGSYCAGGTGVSVGINASDIGTNYELFTGGTLVSTLPGTSFAFNFAPQTTAGVYTIVGVNSTTGCTNNMVGSETISITPLSTPAVSINASPGDTVCVGGHVTFTASPVFGGTLPVYQWTKNSVIVAAGATYSPLPLPANGDVIGVSMTSNYTCLASPLPVSAALILHVEAASLNLDTVKVTRSTVVSGQVDTFVVVAPHGGASPSFQWYVNGTAIPGATNALYITSTLENSDVVKCQVTSSDECTTPKTNFSNSVKILVGTGVGNIVDGNNSFVLVPNPNKGEFTINGTLKDPAENNVSIIITDMLGQTVYNKMAQAANGSLSERITLGSSIANGMYLVKITYGEDREVFHIVVNK